MSEWDEERQAAMEVLRDEVAANDGILKVNMARLRDDSRWGKLGVRVVVDIAKLLDENGLGTLPPELPLNQWDEVRVYVSASPIGQLVKAVQEPSDRGDSTLREAGTNDSAAVLERVRALVCD